MVEETQITDEEEAQRAMQLVEARAVAQTQTQNKQEQFAAELQGSLGGDAAEYDAEEDNEDVQGLMENPPQPMHFPIIAFGAGVTKDLLDVAQVTGFWYIVMLILAAGIWIWLLGKVNFMQKRIIRKIRNKLIARAAGVTILGGIPLLSIIVPDLSFIVWWVYLEHNKVAGAVLRAVEKLEGGSGV